MKFMCVSMIVIYEIKCKCTSNMLSMCSFHVCPHAFSCCYGVTVTLCHGDTVSWCHGVTVSWWHCVTVTPWAPRRVHHPGTSVFIQAWAFVYQTFLSSPQRYMCDFLCAWPQTYSRSIWTLFVASIHILRCQPPVHSTISRCNHQTKDGKNLHYHVDNRCSFQMI